MAIDTTIGGAAANSYATLAEYQAWRVLYYGIDGTEDDLSDELNMMRARAYIDRAYIWKGTRTQSTQALQWPRYNVGYVDGFDVSSSVIPQAIKDAQCEMAYLIQGGATPFATLDGGTIKRKREKVDVIEEETEYADGQARERNAYPLVDSLVADYAQGKVGGKAVSIPLMRA